MLQAGEPLRGARWSPSNPDGGEPFAGAGATRQRRRACSASIAGPWAPQSVRWTRAEFLHKQFDSLDEALSWAHHIKDTGRTALLIEGDDGTRIDKQQLAKALHHRGSEHARAGH